MDQTCPKMIKLAQNVWPLPMEPRMISPWAAAWCAEKHMCAPWVEKSYLVPPKEAITCPSTTTWVRLTHWKQYLLNCSLRIVQSHVLNRKRSFADKVGPFRVFSAADSFAFDRSLSFTLTQRPCGTRKKSSSTFAFLPIESKARVNCWRQSNRVTVQ